MFRTVIATGLVCSALFVTAGAAPAQAQEKGKTGLVMGLTPSTTVGLVVHAADRVAIRPEFSWSRSSSESTGGSNVSGSDSWTAGVGGSVLVYLSTWDALRTYVSPRYAYSKGHITPKTGNPSDSTGHLISGSIGAQYVLGNRFGVFGETGVAYNRSTSMLTLGGAESTNTGLRTGAGVVLYF